MSERSWKVHLLLKQKVCVEVRAPDEDSAQELAEKQWNTGDLENYSINCERIEEVV